MKRQLLLLLTVATLLWSTSSLAAGPAGSLGYLDGANDNPHNLSSGQSGSTPHATDTTEICIFCHTPHGATPQSTLWNRPDPTGPMGGFPLGRVGTLNIDDAGFVGNTHYSTTATEGYPNGTSKLCLSCHDGVTAMGILVNGPSITMTADLLTGAAKIDLSLSHPISFIYDATVAGNLGASYTLPGAASGYLEIDRVDSNITRVQCTSCHQPHQDTRGTGTNYPFWRVGSGTSTDYNTVCNACHTSIPGIPGTKEHQYNP